MYDPKIAIIIPTIHRDELLMKTLNSLVRFTDFNLVKILIIDQNPINSYSSEKCIFYYTAASCFHDKEDRQIEVIKAPYDAGLSYCRNVGVEYAKELGIPYCLISADSIQFNKKMEDLEKIISYLNRYDLIGFDIKDRIGWEGKLELIQNSHFVLDFIKTENCKYCDQNKLVIFKCDIVRNFFIAKTDTLFKTKWDDRLKLREHEDFFWIYKQEGFKVGFTPYFQADYIGEHYKSGNSEYSKLRRKNMTEYFDVLVAKYKLKKWIDYKNKQNMRKGK